MGETTYAHSDDAPVGQWGIQYGTRAPRVTVRERASRGPDKQPALYARWYVEGRRRGPYRVRQVDTIRNPDGDVVMGKRQAAEQEAKRIWQAVQEGTDPAVIFADAEPTEDDDRPDPENLTLRAGLDLALDANEGAFVAARDGWRDQRERQADAICDALGDDLRWTDLTAGKVTSLIKQMRDRYADHPDSRVTGYRTTVQTVEMLARVRRYLAREQAIPTDVPAWPGWRETLEDLFVDAHGDDIDPDRPHHSQAELELIGNAIWDDGYALDPRWRTLLQIALGQRLGAVASRATRSQLAIDDTGAWRKGRLTVPRAGNKPGVRIDLRPATRQIFDQLLSDGYLADLERAYQAGDIDDYHIFPRGRLRRGRARVKNADKAVGKSWLRDQLHALEREIYRRHPGLEIWTDAQHEAGTMHKPGRGWHGLRRAMKKRLDAAGAAPRERNEAMGWVQGSSVPDAIYSDPDDEDRIEDAARARESVLAGLARADVPSDTATDDQSAALAKLIDALGGREAALEALRELGDA